jgi:hypothetical protein
MGGRSVRRVFVEDERRDGKFLRVTWHPDRRTFVVSTWDGSVCVGATRVAVEAAPELIDVFARGLTDAASPVARPTPRTLREHLRAWWRERSSSGEALPIEAAPSAHQRSA